MCAYRSKFLLTEVHNKYKETVGLEHDFVFIYSYGYITIHVIIKYLFSEFHVVIEIHF
jgi:hypothetical protein